MHGEIPGELLVAFLLGSWDDEREADCKILGKLAGRPYSECEAVLSPWAEQAEGPITRTGSIWSWVSRVDAARWLVGRLRQPLLGRFSGAVTTVLGEIDPKFDLPDDEQWAASIHGNVLVHSEALRCGLAEALAMLGSSEVDVIDRVAPIAVRTILDGVSDWRLWSSLDRLLPLLAEAAPDEFLDAVEGAFADPQVATEFLSDSGGVFGSCRHAGLLWALECLVGRPESLTRQ